MPAIIPSIQGSAIATGFNTIWIDSDDPFHAGFSVHERVVRNCPTLADRCASASSPARRRPTGRCARMRSPPNWG